MNLKLLPQSLILILTTLSFSVVAQSDTTYTYYTKDWKKCTRDSAYIISRKFFNGEAWEHNNNWTKTGNPQCLVKSVDKEGKVHIGGAKYFREDGTLHKIIIMEKSKVVMAEYFYTNGKKSGELMYGSKEPIYKGWDTNGVSVKGFIAEREALFPGGALGWQTYLERNLNADVAAKSSKGAGNYTVRVKFKVNADGSISDAIAIEATDGCMSCPREAVRVVSDGPKWRPALMNNEPVEFEAIQHITFQVLENTPGKDTLKRKMW